MRSIGILACLTALAVSTATAASLSGTWKLDTARSRMDPPVRLVWERTGPGSYKHTSPSFNAVPWLVDGTPIPSPAEEGILVSRKRLNDRVFEEIRSQNGKPVSKVTRTVSQDGKRLTVAGKGANADGERFDYVTLYSRVGAPGRDPLAGTWEEDFFSQAREPIVISIQENGQQFAITGKGYAWMAPFTGMQSVVSLPWADHAHVERLSQGHVKAQLTKSGRVTREEEYQLSGDSQTLTVRRRLPGAKPARGFYETYVRAR